MGSAFDAELDKLHAAADEAFGVQMVYRAANAPPVTVWAEKLAPAPEFGGAAARMTAKAMMLMVRVAVMPSKPVKDAIFDELDGVGAVVGRWRVIASPSIDDDDGKRYAIKAEPCT